MPTRRGGVGWAAGAETGVLLVTWLQCGPLDAWGEGRWQLHRRPFCGPAPGPPRALRRPFCGPSLARVDSSWQTPRLRPRLAELLTTCADPWLPVAPRVEVLGVRWEPTPARARLWACRAERLGPLRGSVEGTCLPEALGEPACAGPTFGLAPRELRVLRGMVQPDKARGRHRSERKGCDDSGEQLEE